MAKRKLSSIARPDRIMSIDSSTNSIAFGIFEESDLVRYGKLLFHGDTLYHKAGDAAKKMSQFVEIYSIRSIVIESSIFMNSPQSALALATMQGAILGSAQMAGAKDILSVTPIQWQSYIGNKRLDAEEKLAIRKANPGKSASWYKGKERQTRKQRTMDIINKKFALDIRDDDVADSIGVGWFAVDNWSKLRGQPNG